MTLKNFLPMLGLAALLSGCSNDALDEPINTGETQSNFINVSIRMANHGTRGDETRDFENGTDKESEIKRVVFAFYNAEGVCVASSSYDDPDVETNSNGNNVETTYTKAVEFQLPVGAKLPVSMMVYVNPSTTNVGSLTLSEVKTALRKSYKIDGLGFTMNNAVYFDSEGKKQIEVLTPANKYYTLSDTGAASDPDNKVEVYVERMAVKAELAFDTEFGSHNAEVELSNSGTPVKIKFVADNWGLTCTEKQMYLIKHYDPSVYTPEAVTGSGSSSGQNDKFLWIGWNDTNDHRSYWANSVTYGRDKSKYPDVSDDLLQSTANDFLTTHASYKDNEPLNYLSYNEIKGNISEPLYCNENTVSNFTPSAATSVIIAGHYEYVNPTDPTNPNVGTFYVRNSDIYTEDGLKLFFLHRIKSYLKYYNGTDWVDVNLLSNETFNAIKGDFVLAHPTKGLNTAGGTATKNTERLVTLVLKNNLTKYKFIEEGGTEVQISTTNLNTYNNKIYAMASVAEAFTDGKAVFFWALRHLNSNPDGIGHYGAVRNHWYKVNVKSISGLGIGVFDPDAPLVPHDDETKFGINISVNVLAWLLVNNDADL